MNLADSNFLRLETYRTSGEAVSTIVWAVELKDQIWVRTAKRTGKVRRIRENHKVSLAPCGNDEAPVGESQAYLATLFEDAKIGALIDSLLREKYGAVADSTFTLRESEKIYIGLECIQRG